MSTNLTATIQQLQLETRIQYGLMFLFGTLCLLAAIAPLGTVTKAVVVSALFGFTGGIWISHLVQIVQKAADRKGAANS